MLRLLYLYRLKLVVQFYSILTIIDFRIKTLMEQSCDHFFIYCLLFLSFNNLSINLSIKSQARNLSSSNLHNAS